MSRKRKSNDKGNFHTFQTEGYSPGTKVGYYAEHPISEVGVSIKTKRQRRKK